MLVICLALSLALHLGMLVALPGIIPSYEPLKARVFDVVLLRETVPPVPLATGAEVLSQPPRIRPRDVPATANLPKLAEPVAAQVRKPESKPVTPLAMAVTEPPRAVDSDPRPSLSAKQDEARPATPPRTETAAAGRDTAAAASPPSFNAAYLRNPLPLYPLVARRNGEQGTVTLKVRVTREGNAASVAVEKTSGSAHLDDAALETVRTWHFVPARQGSQPVEAWVLVPVVFRLQPAS